MWDVKKQLEARLNSTKNRINQEMLKSQKDVEELESLIEKVDMEIGLSNFRNADGLLGATAEYNPNLSLHAVFDIKEEKHDENDDDELLMCLDLRFYIPTKRAAYEKCESDNVTYINVNKYPIQKFDLADQSGWDELREIVKKDILTFNFKNNKDDC